MGCKFDLRHKFKGATWIWKNAKELRRGRELEMLKVQTNKKSQMFIGLNVKLYGREQKQN